jgi:signal transduction histidine kinase
MIGLIVLTFVPAIAAVMFWRRARREQRARIAAETRLADFEHAARRSAQEDRAAAGADRRRRLLGVVAHELRSPISAILGYQELLAEGIFGELDERAHEPAARIRFAAHQLLNLIDGMYELAHAADPHTIELGRVEIEPLVHAVHQNAASEGAGRGVTLELDMPDAVPDALAEAQRLRRALDLIVAAAIKGSPNGKLTLGAASDERHVLIFVDGTRLDPARDAPDPATPDAVDSGAALRIAMAAAAARTFGGRVSLVRHDEESSRLALSIPRP